MTKRDLFVLCTFLLLGFLCCYHCCAKPVTPEVKKEDKKFQYPDLNYESNWGKLTIDRNNGQIILREHPIWEGEAKFVTPTKVYVIWYLIENGKAAPGIYDLEKDGSLIGVWNWDSDILIDEKTWEATGDLRADRIHPQGK